jgi:hypothetical protein
MRRSSDSMLAMVALAPAMGASIAVPAKRERNSKQGRRIR